MFRRLCCFFSAVAIFASASLAHAASLTSSVDRDTIEIGDTVLLAIRAEATETTLFSPPGELDLSPFEIRSLATDSTARTFEMKIELQTFELGRIAVPSFPVHFRTGSLIDVLATDTFPVFVQDLTDTSDTELRPIRGILEPEEEKSWTAVILLALLAGLILAILLYRLLRKRGASLFAPARPRDPLDIFRDEMREFDRLVETDPPRMKEAFSLLTESVKHLILARERIDVTGATTTETLEHPAIRRWARADYDDLKQILDRADLVKFARMTVTRGDATEARHRAERIAASRYAPAPESAPVTEARR